MRKIYGLFALIFSLLCLLHGAASSYDPRSDPEKVVKIAEFSNSPAAQLLLVSLNKPVAEMTEEPPAWQTLRSDTEGFREELSLASVISVYDIIFTSDLYIIQKIFDQGLIKSFFPIFSDELVLVGPTGLANDFSGMGLSEVMGKIFSQELLFFTLLRNPWSATAEMDIWRNAGVDSPGVNRQYVESGRDDITAQFQAGDEGAFMLVGEASFAQYSDSQREEPALEKITGTGIYSSCYLCVVKPSGFRKQRAALAENFAAWFKSDEAREVINSFELGGTRPFSAVAPLL
jgi:ABC-type tungstate transport system permease subunit